MNREALPGVRPDRPADLAELAVGQRQPWRPARSTADSELIERRLEVLHQLRRHVEAGQREEFGIELARARELEANYGPRFAPPASLVEKAERGELYGDVPVLSAA